MSISKIKKIKEEIEKRKEEIEKRKWFIKDAEKHIDKVKKLKTDALWALQEFEYYLGYDIGVVDKIDSLANSLNESISIMISIETLYNEGSDKLERNLREKAVYYEKIITDLEVEIEQLEEELEEEKTKTKKKVISR